MNLTVNTVIEWLENEANCGNIIERILQIDVENNFIATIEIFSADALPIVRKYSQVLGAFSNGILRVLVEDPFQLPFVSEEDIPEKHKEIRDKSWAFVSEVVALGFDAFDYKKRGIAITKLIKEYKKTKRDIYKKLRRYWQKGLTKNTLLPSYKNCGSPGKRKLGNSPTDTKLGRKKILEKTTGEVTGIRITPLFEKWFERSIKRNYENKEKASLTFAYQKTLEEFFHVGYEPILLDGKKNLFQSCRTQNICLLSSNSATGMKTFIRIRFEN